MLTLRIDLLTGRYSAAHPTDRNKVEWPPHPYRVFCALIAANASDDNPIAPVHRAALEWLENQPPPSVVSTADDIATRRVHTHFVPVNDANATGQRSAHDRLFHNIEAALVAAQTASGTAAANERAASKLQKRRTEAQEQSAKWTGGIAPNSALEVLPQHRGKQARTFPVCAPADPTVFMVWDNADVDASTLATLDEMAQAVGRLGHSSSMVAMSFHATAPPHRPNSETLVADEANGDRQLRTPRPGLLNALEREFAKAGPISSSIPARCATSYSLKRQRGPWPRSEFGERWVVLDLVRVGRGPADEPDRPFYGTPRTSLAIASAIRKAVIRYATPRDAAPTGATAGAVLSGHEDDGRPTRESHLAVVPLPNVGNQHADGSFRAVALVLPRDKGRELLTLRSVVSQWIADGGALYGAGFERCRVRITPGVGPWSENPKRWAGPASVWFSATPTVLRGFPGDLFSSKASERTKAERKAYELVARSCVDSGLPRPVGIRLSRDPLLVGADRADRYARYRPEKGAPTPQIHIAVEFDEEVVGPVLLGSGRFFGYGLMAPVRDKKSDTAATETTGSEVAS